MPRWKAANERFWSRVRKTDDCWEWEGSVSSDTGYGCFYDGKPYSTHRYSWNLHHGSIPRGLCVLHKCDNRRCIRPDHLFLGTKKQNSQDMAAKGRERVPALKGQQHGEAKLKDEDVVRIRNEVAVGRKQKELARELGVSVSLISMIVLRKAWKHL